MADQEKPKDEAQSSDKPKSDPDTKNDENKNVDGEKDKQDEKKEDDNKGKRDEKKEDDEGKKEEKKNEPEDEKDRPKSSEPKVKDEEKKPESPEPRPSSAKSRPPSAKSRPPSAKSRPHSAKSRPPSSGRKSKVEEEKPASPALEDKSPDTGGKEDQPSRAPSVQDTTQEKVPSPPVSARQTPRGRATPQKDTGRLKTPDTARSSPRVSRNKGRTPDGATATPPMTAKSTDSSKGGLCDICPQLEGKKTEKADFYCDSCKQRFCLRCAKRHVETAVFSAHSISPITPKPDDDITLGDIPCKTHPKWTLGFYCHGCQQVACGLCISFNHGGNVHNIERAENLEHNKHILLARYEKLMRNDSLSNNKTVTPTSPAGRPVARLLWRRESTRGDTLEDEDQEDDPGNLCGPCDVAFLPRGQVVVADRWNKCVKFFDEEGNNPSIVLSHIAPLRLCATPAGRVAVVDDYGGGQVKILHMEELAQRTLEELARMETEKTRLRLERTQLNAEKPQSNTDQSPSSNSSNSDPAQIQTSPENIDETGNDSTNKTNDPHRANEGNAETKPGSLNTENADTHPKEGLNSRGATRGKTDMVGKLGDLGKEDSLVIDGNVGVYKQWKPTHIKRPWAIAVNKLGQWVVSEYEQYIRASVVVYHADGGLVRSFGGHGERDDQFDWPGYLATDARGRVIVSDYWSHALKVYDPKGKFVTKIGKGWGKQDGHLTFPKGVCVDSDNHILVVDSGNNRVCEFSPDGEFVRHVLTEAEGLMDPEGIAFVQVKDQEEDFDSELGQLTGRSTNQKGEQHAQAPAGDQPEVKAPQRRLAVTLSKGHDYGAVMVFNYDTESTQQ